MEKHDSRQKSMARRAAARRRGEQQHHGEVGEEEQLVAMVRSSNTGEQSRGQRARASGHPGRHEIEIGLTRGGSRRGDALQLYTARVLIALFRSRGVYIN